MVDQREIQRRGGKCARFPSSCLIHDLLLEAGLEPRGLVVFDLTYGQGRFYGAWRPRVLIGADIYIYEWVVTPDLFVKAPAWASWRRVRAAGIKVDLVVVDPPWVVRGSSKRRLFGLDLALGGPTTILEAAARAASELGVDYMLVHFKRRWVPGGWVVVSEAGLLYITRYNERNDITWFGVLQSS